MPASPPRSGTSGRSIHAQDPRTLEEGKLAVVHRLGEAARTIDERRRRGDGCPVMPAYPQLYAIALRRPLLSGPARRGPGDRRRRRRGLRGTGGAAGPAPCDACKRERAARLADAGAAPDAPGGAAGDDSRPAMIGAWLAPMLLGSISTSRRSAAGTGLARQAQADLAQWLRHVGQDERRPGEADLPISLEIALAQGFKYAANRRPAQPDTAARGAHVPGRAGAGDAQGCSLLVLPADLDPRAVPAEPVRQLAVSRRPAGREAGGDRAALARCRRPRAPVREPRGRGAGAAAPVRHARPRSSSSWR